MILYYTYIISGCEGPGFNSSRCQLHGLGVRHFKVSGGVPSPPEQPPGNWFKNQKVRRINKQTTDTNNVI